MISYDVNTAVHRKELTEYERISALVAFGIGISYFHHAGEMAKEELIAQKKYEEHLPGRLVSHDLFPCPDTGASQTECGSSHYRVFKVMQFIRSLPITIRSLERNRLNGKSRAYRTRPATT